MLSGLADLPRLLSRALMNKLPKQNTIHNDILLLFHLDCPLVRQANVFGLGNLQQAE